MSFENWKILKSDLEEKQEEYSEVAAWCNANGYHIEDDGTYYKVVENPEPTEEEMKIARIVELKHYLAETDYVVIKITEGVATSEDYADILTKRQSARREINELEK